MYVHEGMSIGMACFRCHVMSRSVIQARARIVGACCGDCMKVKYVYMYVCKSAYIKIDNENPLFNSL